jgi:hypothetical protein
VRSQIVALATEFHQIKTAGRTCDDARAQINALVQSLAARGRPRMDVQRGEVRVYGWMGDEISHGVPVPHVDNLQTICWLAPHMVIDKLDEMLEALPVDAHALPISERAERLAGIEEKIFDLEIQEECVVEAAAEDGVVIPRRSDASPASILGVRVIGEATEREAA